MRRLRSTFLALVALALAELAFAHGGGLDKNGCHNDRKHGGYHCHRAPAAPITAPVASPTEREKNSLAQAQPVSQPTCYTGPRGGRYTITKSGKKNYRGC